MPSATQALSRRTLILGTLAAAAAATAPTAWASAANDALALLNSGEHLAIMRHALAPGTGDPPALRLDDCTTQRNLSNEGRAQATRIGERLREAGIAKARVFTSQWCRARDTARLLGYGPPEDLALLNSFFAARGDGPAQTRALRAWIAAVPLAPPVLLVSHQVNITALAEIFPASGEIVILRRGPAGALTVAGRIAAPG